MKSRSSSCQAQTTGVSPLQWYPSAWLPAYHFRSLYSSGGGYPHLPPSPHCAAEMQGQSEPLPLPPRRRQPGSQTAPLPHLPGAQFFTPAWNPPSQTAQASVGVPSSSPPGFPAVPSTVPGLSRSGAWTQSLAHFLYSRASCLFLGSAKPAVRRHLI